MTVFQNSDAIITYVDMSEFLLHYTVDINTAEAFQLSSTENALLLFQKALTYFVDVDFG